MKTARKVLLTHHHPERNRITGCKEDRDANSILEIEWAVYYLAAVD